MSNSLYFQTLTIELISSLRCGYRDSKKFPAIQMLSCTDFFRSVSAYTFLYTQTSCSPNSRLKSRVCGSLIIIPALTYNVYSLSFLSKMSIFNAGNQFYRGRLNGIGLSVDLIGLRSVKGITRAPVIAVSSFETCTVSRFRYKSSFARVVSWDGVKFSYDIWQTCFFGDNSTPPAPAGNDC